MRILLAFVLLFLPISVFAQPIVINEIAWMGTPVSGVEEKQWWRYEWLELYNSADTVGMLDGWNVELYRGDELYFKIPLGETIPPHGYFLVGALDKIPGVDVNYSNLGGKFLNTGQKVVLSNALGTVIDEIDATLGWHGGDNKTKQTMERVAGSDPTTVWQTSADSGGTPKAPNSAGVAKEPVKLRQAKEFLSLSKDEQIQTEKDLAGSSRVELNSVKDFQSRVPIVNPITLLAGLLALGFSGALLLVKRSLALRQRSGQASRQEHQKS